MTQRVSKLFYATRFAASLHLFSISVTFTSVAFAASPLPYSTRTRGYSGWSSAVRGDIRTLGIAGATVGLADTFIASGDNPAGLAMTLENTGTQISANRVHDGDIQSYDEPLLTSNFGAAASIYPWGISAGYWSPQFEGQRYILPASQNLIGTEVLTQEFRVSVARLFLDNKLSLGTSLILGKSTETLEFPSSPQLNLSQKSYTLGASAGVLYQFPGRFLVGLSGSLPITHPIQTSHPTPGISNFFQSVKTPTRIGVGCGWIPNRFFKTGFSIFWIGATPNTALLSNNDKVLSTNATLQPRLGAEYLLAEFKEFEMRLYAGTYLETSRIENTPTRLHGTGGIEAKAWILSLGWGLDEGPRYENFIFTAGIDVLKLLRKLDLIPPEWRPPYGGMLPRATEFTDEGLARPLVQNWTETHHNPNILEIGKELPGRIENRLQKTGKDLEGLGKEIGKEIEKGLKGAGEGLLDIMKLK